MGTHYNELKNFDTKFLTHGCDITVLSTLGSWN